MGKSIVYIGFNTVHGFRYPQGVLECIPRRYGGGGLYCIKTYFLKDTQLHSTGARIEHMDSDLWVSFSIPPSVTSNPYLPAGVIEEYSPKHVLLNQASGKAWTKISLFMDEV